MVMQIPVETGALDADIRTRSGEKLETVQRISKPKQSNLHI